MIIKYCLIRTKAQLSHSETKILHHMSFLIEFPALGVVHFMIVNFESVN